MKRNAIQIDAKIPSPLLRSGQGLGLAGLTSGGAAVAKVVDAPTSTPTVNNDPLVSLDKELDSFLEDLNRDQVSGAIFFSLSLVLRVRNGWKPLRPILADVVYPSRQHHPFDPAVVTSQSVQQATETLLKAPSKVQITHPFLAASASLSSHPVYVPAAPLLPRTILRSVRLPQELATRATV